MGIIYIYGYLNDVWDGDISDFLAATWPWVEAFTYLFNIFWNMVGNKFWLEVD